MLCTPIVSTIMKAARIIDDAGCTALTLATNARYKAATSDIRIRVAAGIPSSTANCSARLCVWSKKATGRCGNGVNDHAKLNSPKPTPNHGCCAMSDSVSDQIAYLELEMSPCVPMRASPPKTWCVECAHCARPHHKSA